MKTAINTNDSLESTSKGVIFDNTLYISGQIGSDPNSGKIIADDIESETKQVLENIKSVLSAANIDFSHVVKASIYLIDISDLDKVNAIYGSYFTGDFPACEVLEASNLRLNARIEISAIAAK